MKILIIDNSGIHKRQNKFYTNSLNGIFIKELVENGTKVTYYQFYVDTDDEFNMFDLKANNVKCVFQRYFKNRIIRYILAYVNILPQILKNDFIYFYYPSSFKYASIFCWILRKPYGVYIRGMQGLKDKFSLIVYKRAFVVFTVSDFFTEYVKNKVKKNMVFTVKPMIPFSDRDVISRVHKPKLENYNILFLGRIDKEKGLIELIKAFSILIKKFDNINLKIVGSGLFMDSARNLVEKFNLGQNIVFMGAVQGAEKIKEIYMGADLYILPTYHEGFPRTLYEAMIFNIPIITTFVGGIPSLMKDNINSIEIEPMSIESIVKAISYALTNYDKMQVLADNGRETVTNIIHSTRPSHAKHLLMSIKRFNYE